MCLLAGIGCLFIKTVFRVVLLHAYRKPVGLSLGIVLALHCSPLTVLVLLLKCSLMNCITIVLPISGVLGILYNYINILYDYVMYTYYALGCVNT